MARAIPPMPQLSRCSILVEHMAPPRPSVYRMVILDINSYGRRMEGLHSCNIGKRVTTNFANVCATGSPVISRSGTDGVIQLVWKPLLSCSNLFSFPSAIIVVKPRNTLSRRDQQRVESSRSFGPIIPL